MARPKVRRSERPPSVPGWNCVLRLLLLTPGVLLAFGPGLFDAYAGADAVGGGWLGGGVAGQYYNNSSRSGAPSFTRRDVRLNFNWSAYGTPGGSRSPAFAAIGHTNFSVEWTGQLSPRFSESYTFTMVASNSAALYLWPVNGSKSSALLLSSLATNSAAADLVAGQTYNVEVDYNSGMVDPPVCQLLWSSPGTPVEVIDTVTVAGLNVDTYAAYNYQLYANAMDDGRDEWGDYNSNFFLPPGARDANGWPTTDATNIVFEGAGVNGGSIVTGAYLLQFQGQATVTANIFGASSLLVDGTNFGGTLPFGVGYNAVSNLTTAALTINTNNAGILYLGFQGTRRNPADTTNTGVANVKLMRPVSPGNTNSFPVGTCFYTNFENAVQRFTILRWILNNETTPDTEWNRRPPSELPAYATKSSQGSQRYWEYMVMLANECGKDLYVCFPVAASNDYLTNVAHLIAYGSDGVNPYTSPQANPAYPPLNPNLRVVLEHENEVWNFSFANWGDNVTAMLEAYTNNTPDWQIVDYDNCYNPATGAGNQFQAAMRWHILRAARCSDIFRGVFGSAAMGARVRVIYEYQYDNLNGTASDALPFLDNYFNNADGATHMATPYPVSHYLWGAGGAVYYGSGDENGIQTNLVFADSGFETPALASGQAGTNPPGAAWTFTGNAGIYNGATGGAGGPPAPPHGSQAAFIQGSGAISQTINFTAAGAYALSFQSAEPATNANSVQFYFDNTLITPNGNYANGASPYQWLPGSFGVSAQVFNNYSTYVFQVTNAGSHTLTVQGLGIGQYAPLNAPPNNNRFIYFDDLEIASAAALFAGGIPGPGYANGQAGDAGYAAQLDAQAVYAQAYGLQVVAYEGGWSLGGDFGKTAFENWCEFYDPRAETANLSALDTFARSGSRYYIFGTYETWPGYDTANAGSYPLVQAVDAANAALPAAPLNGISVPNVLTPGKNSWWIAAAAGSGTLNGTGSWFDWNVLMPVSGNFLITPGYQAGAGAVLEVDGVAVSAGVTVTNFLTQGLHTLKLRSTSGSFTVTNVTVSQIGAPNPVTLQSPVVAVGQNDSVTLTWSPASSGPVPQGYLVYGGPASGVYPAALAATAMTNYTVTGLTNGVTLYFTVVATNGLGYSLPSNEINVTPVAPGATQDLLAWDFSAAGGHAASDGNVTSVGSTSMAYGMQAGTITRGGGSPAESIQFPGVWGYGAMNMNASATSTTWVGASLPAAVAANSYFQFGAGPADGNQFSIASLVYVAYQQNADSNSTMVLEYSTNNFATPGIPVNTNNMINSGWKGATNTVFLAGFAALQNLANTVTFRLYGYGFQGYDDKGLGLVPGGNPDVAVIGSVFYPVALPTFNPPGGAYSVTNVTISTTTVGSSINFTTDGSTPTPVHGTPYTGPVRLGANTTLQAIAYQTNFVNSAVASASYVINPQPSPVFINLRKIGANLQMSWAPGGSLLQAANVTGPWNTNTGASSPWIVSPTSACMFYRLVR